MVTTKDTKSTKEEFDERSYRVAQLPQDQAERRELTIRHRLFFLF